MNTSLFEIQRSRLAAAQLFLIVAGVAALAGGLAAVVFAVSLAMFLYRVRRGWPTQGLHAC